MVHKGFKTFTKTLIKTKHISIMNLTFYLVFFVLLTSCCFTSALKCYRCVEENPDADLSNGFFHSIPCWDNCPNNLGVFLTVATASWDTVMFVILHATLFDIHAPFYWCLTLCNENMEFDPQNKKMTPPPPSKPPSIGA